MFEIHRVLIPQRGIETISIIRGNVPQGYNSSSKATGNVGVPQGGPFSPLAANIYLNQVDWVFDALRRKTTQGPFEAINYHRFSDDMVITISGYHSKHGWAERALERLVEELGALGVCLNYDKTRIVNKLKGDAFGFLGFDLHRIAKKGKSGYFILMTPQKKARKTVKARIRDIISNSGAAPAKEIVSKVNQVLIGCVNS